MNNPTLLAEACHRFAGHSPIIFASLLGFPPLYPWQSEMLNLKSQYSQWNIHRQGGKSSTAALLGYHLAAFKPDSLILVVAPSERQSVELLLKVKKLGKAAADLSLGAAISSENVTTINFANGSRFVALPGTEGTIKGYSKPSLIILDEAAQISDAVYAAVSPMLAVSANGKLMMLSTPWGQRGFYHDIWMSGGDEWLRIEHPATQCPSISAKWLQEERGRIGDVMFRTNYMCKFLPNESSLFTLEDVQDSYVAGEPYINMGTVIPMPASKKTTWGLSMFSPKAAQAVG